MVFTQKKDNYIPYTILLLDLSKGYQFQNHIIKISWLLNSVYITMFVPTTNYSLVLNKSLIH